MATQYNKLEIFINRDLENIIKAKQFDAQSRYLEVTLLQDDGTAVDLTGHIVRFNALKSDSTHVFNDCEVTDAEGGVILVELTDQTLAIGESKVICDISIHSEDETAILTTRTFEIKVQSMVRDDDAIESSDEYGAVINIFQDVWDIRYRIVRMDELLGDLYDDIPEGGVAASGISLMGAFNQWYNWSQTQSTAALAAAVADMLAVLGVANPTETSSTDTVMNFLNYILTALKDKSPITRIQRGTAAQIYGTDSKTRTIGISSVTLTKAVLITDMGSYGDYSNSSTIALTNATTITQTYAYSFYSSATLYAYPSFNWTIIEFA